MKGVLYTIMAFTFLCIVSSCKENVKTGLTSTKTFEVDSIPNRTDIANKDSVKKVTNTIKSYLNWSENHNDYNASILDSQCIKGNEFWYFRKDGSLLMDKLNKLYISKKNAYLTQEDRTTTIDISVYSLKKNNFVSLYELTITSSFRRDSYECFQTFINYNNGIYLARIKSTEHIRKLISDYVKKYKIKYVADFDFSRDFDFYISDGDLCLVPFYEKDIIEAPDSDADEIPGGIKIELDNEIVFQLTNVDDIIKEYSFNVLYCKINPSGLKYDNLNVIEYKGKFYSPRIDACYINGELRTLDVYKSDGIISYTNKDLKRDNLLTKHLDIPLNRTIIIQTDTISDNGIASIYENRRDSIFVEKTNEIIIYYTKSGE